MATIVREVKIPAGGVTLEGDLSLPDEALGIVIFAHGSGSSRKSLRNRAVAAALQEARFATLLLDLLTLEEERAEAVTRHFRFDITLLAGRLAAATQWVSRDAQTRTLPVGFFGASTGAAAALVAAVRLGDVVHAIVSRGGRPDMAGAHLADVTAPTLLIVGGHDEEVLELNQRALDRLRGVKHLVIVPRATHLFEEPGALARVTELARAWFEQHLVGVVVAQ